MEEEVVVSVDCLDNMLMVPEIAQQKLEAIESRLGIKASQRVEPSMEEKDLREAGEMYIYLIYCPTDDTRLSHWLTFYKDLFHNSSLATIALTVSRLVTTVPEEREKELQLARLMFDKVSTVLGLRSRDLSVLTSSHSDNVENELTARHYRNISQCLNQIGGQRCEALKLLGNKQQVHF